MGQLVVDDIPRELLDRLDGYAKQLGVSVPEAARRILSDALTNDDALVERNGLLLHSGTPIPGEAWPTVEDVRSERTDELIAGTREGSV